MRPHRRHSAKAGPESCIAHFVDVLYKSTFYLLICLLVYV